MKGFKKYENNSSNDFTIINIYNVVFMLLFAMYFKIFIDVLAFLCILSIKGNSKKICEVMSSSSIFEKKKTYASKIFCEF